MNTTPQQTDLNQKANIAFVVVRRLPRRLIMPGCEFL